MKFNFTLTKFFCSVFWEGSLKPRGVLAPSKKCSVAWESFQLTLSPRELEAEQLHTDGTNSILPCLCCSGHSAPVIQSISKFNPNSDMCIYFIRCAVWRGKGLLFLFYVLGFKLREELGSGFLHALGQR